MNIVVIGLGKVGLEVVEQLTAEGHSVTVADIDARKVDTVLGIYDTVGVVGSATDHKVLKEANCGNADLVIALTDNDEMNLTCCLMSKKLGAKNTIARARKPEYNLGIHLIREDLGLSLCINPERETAREIARILKFPLAKNVEPFAKGKVELIEYVATKESPLCGKTVNDVFAKMKNTVLICGVQRGGEMHIPYGNFLIEEDDILMLIAAPVRMSAFFREAGIKTTGVHDVIIIGGGTTTYYLSELLTKQHLNVTIIENDPATAESIAERIPEATVILGDGTSQQILEEEGLRDADALCCMTGIDEENIIASMYASTLSQKIKTITKINRTELTHIVKPLEVGSVVNPKKLAAYQILKYVRAKQNSEGTDVLSLYKLADGKAEALEFPVTELHPEMQNVPLSELNIRPDAIVASINRHGTIITPRGSDVLLKGDTVIVVTTRSGLDSIDDILEIEE